MAIGVKRYILNMANPETNTSEVDDSFYLHRTVVVDPGQQPLRIDKYLMDRLEKVSRNRIQTGIKQGAILVNEKQVKSNHIVKPLQEISILLPEPPREGFEVIPEDIPLEIVYEDDDLLIVNKKAGMVVHPGTGNFSGTLVNALAFHIGTKDKPILEGNPNNRPYLVHRIDKDTSGLLVVAKTELAMSELAKQFFDHTIERKYQAIIWGSFDEETGTITGHIGRSPKDRRVMKVFPDGDFGKDATTHYKVLQDLYYVSLIECQLETGRTHQIRVHMKHKSRPIFSDARYGGDKIVKGTVFSKYKQFVFNTFKEIPRQALHAKSLGFVHPRTGEKVYFESELPDDMKAALDRWTKYLDTRKSKL